MNLRFRKIHKTRMYEAVQFHNIILENEDQKHILKGTGSRKEISKRLTKIVRTRPK